MDEPKKPRLTWKAQEGTFGGCRSAEALDKMIIATKDPYLVRKVGRLVGHWSDRSSGIAQYVTEKQLRIDIMDIYFKRFVDRAMTLTVGDGNGGHIPVDKDIRTHLVCVLAAIKRKALSS